MTNQPRRSDRDALTPLYTVMQAAALFQVCRLTVIRWIQTGHLEATKIGGHWRITEREIRRVMGQREP